MEFIEKIKNSLELLELEKEERLDFNILKKAYLKTSKKYHPDICEDEYKDGVMFKKVNEAYLFLKDNISLANDFLINPDKYKKSYTTSYEYSNINDDFFSRVFNEYMNRKEYDEKNIKRYKRRMWIKRFASFSMALIILFLIYVSPNLATFITLLSIILFTVI